MNNYGPTCHITSDLATEAVHVQTYVDDVTMSRLCLNCSLINILPGNSSMTSSNDHVSPCYYESSSETHDTMK